MRKTILVLLALLLATGAYAQIGSPPGIGNPPFSTGGSYVWTGSNTFTDNLFFLKDNTTPTKLAQFQLDQLAVGTKTFTLPSVGSATPYLLSSGGAISLPAVSSYTTTFGVSPSANYALQVQAAHATNGRATAFFVEASGGRIISRAQQTTAPITQYSTTVSSTGFTGAYTATLSNGMTFPYSGYGAGFTYGAVSAQGGEIQIPYALNQFVSRDAPREPMRYMTSGVFTGSARPELANNSYTGSSANGIAWGGAQAEVSLKGGNPDTVDVVVVDGDASINAGFVHIVGDTYTNYETIDISAGAGTYTSARTYSNINVIKTTGVATVNGGDTIAAGWTAAAVAATSTATLFETPSGAGWVANIHGPGGFDTYSFVATVAMPGQVKIGVDAAATMANLVCAINDLGCTEGAGQDYMAFAPSSYATAVDAGGGSATLTALTAGGDINDSTAAEIYNTGVLQGLFYWTGGAGGALLAATPVVNQNRSQFIVGGNGPVYPMTNNVELKCADPAGCEVTLPGNAASGSWEGATVTLTALKANNSLAYNPVILLSEQYQILEAPNEPGAYTGDFWMNEYDSIALRQFRNASNDYVWKEVWRNAPLFQQGFAPVGTPAAITSIEATKTTGIMRLYLPSDSYANGTDTIALKDDALDNEAEDSTRNNSKWLKSLITGGYALGNTNSVTSPPDGIKVTVDDPTDDQNPGMRVQVCGLVTAGDQLSGFRTCETLIFVDEGNQTTVTEFMEVTEIKSNTLVDAAADVTIAAEWASDALAIFAAGAPVDHPASDFVPVPGFVIQTMDYVSLKCLDEVGCDYEPAAAAEDGKELIIYVLAGSTTITVTESATMLLAAGPYTLNDNDTMRFIYNGTDAVWAMTAISQN